MHYFHWISCRRTFSSPSSCWTCRTMPINKVKLVLQTHYPDHPLLTTLLANGSKLLPKKPYNYAIQSGIAAFTFQALFKAQARHDLAENCLSQIVDFFQSKQITDYKCFTQCLAPFSKSGALSLAVIIATSVKKWRCKSIKRISTSRTWKKQPSAVNWTSIRKTYR